MLNTNVIRTDFFKTTQEVTLYMGAENEESEAGTLPVGSEVFAALHGNETRSLNGKRQPVVIFSIGDSAGLYWISRSQFESCTRWFDPKTRTSIPFQN